LSGPSSSPFLVSASPRTADQIEQMIRQVIPANQVKMIVDNMGIPYSGINTSYNNTGTMSAADCDILVSLNENHSPTGQFVQAIRARMPHDFPDVGVWFPPADIVSQTLNFGMPAPIDIRITGANLTDNFNFASKLTQQIRHISGAVDFRIQEPNNVPQLNISIDRSLASILGITAQSVTQSVLSALSGSEQTSPNFWVDPGNRVSYEFNAQVPQYDLPSLDDLRNLPILGGQGQGQILAMSPRFRAVLPLRSRITITSCRQSTSMERSMVKIWDTYRIIYRNWWMPPGKIYLEVVLFMYAGR
jgi:multidrug efflux pump subunit AcrB